MADRPGLNVNRGQKICLRLRYPRDRGLFLPFEDVVDTMLHELAHIIHGPHDAKFHALWDQLRDEHQGLVLKGYTGEGFLSKGHRLGGARIPPHEARRLAKEAAEKRRVRPTGTIGGRRLGGVAPRPGEAIRTVIADAVERRNTTLKGCGTERLSDSQIRKIADTATQNGFRTQAEEDEANEAAIAQALWELVQEDEKAKYGSSYIHPTANNPTGNGGGALKAQNRDSKPGPSRSRDAENDIRRARPPASKAGQPRSWICDTCTLVNPLEFLSCDACGTERSVKAVAQKKEDRRSWSPKPARERAVVDLTQSPSRDRQQGTASQTKRVADTPPATSQTPWIWNCSLCATAMEQKWWTCSFCGKMKESS